MAEHNYSTIPEALYSKKETQKCLDKKWGGERKETQNDLQKNLGWIESFGKTLKVMARLLETSTPQIFLQHYSEPILTL